MTRVGLGLG